MNDFDLENSAVELERAENLIMIYTDFIDDECPLNIKPCDVHGKVATDVFCYVNRTEMFRSVLTAAFDTIREVKKAMYKEAGLTDFE